MAEKVKVYSYTRVSTSIQTEGYSLEAQDDRIQRYADYMDYEIVEKYQDAGKSGKNIAGRSEFQRMLEDIRTGKDDVEYVLVFKLSRFGRNAADALSSLQFMQDFGVNLISVEESIDSSKDAGKLMISVLSAVSEIERENILVQTMEGRKQKARSGSWNGGFSPYGYQLVNGELKIAEDEAEAIRKIFDLYVNTEFGSNKIAKYLEQQGIKKKVRQNGTNTLFSAHMIRMILDNPVYCGKIAFGRRSNQKIKGTRNEYHVVKMDNYLLSDGKHEAIVSEELWKEAQKKRIAQAKKYEHVNRGNSRIHLLSGLLRCPVCGAGMYGNKSIKRKNGKHYKDYYFYGCKHRQLNRGHKCTYRKQLHEEKLNAAVAEVISKMVSNPKFASVMQSKINMKVDTKEIDAEIENYTKQHTKYIGTKRSLEKQIDNLDVCDKHYDRKLNDLQKRLDKMYDSIADTEDMLEEARTKKRTIESEKLTGENIYKLLIHFDKVYDTMNDEDKRALLVALIKEIHVYEEEQANGQWLKSIKFNLPLLEEQLELGLDNDTSVETVVLLSKGEVDSKKIRVEFSLEDMDMSEFQDGATYTQIKDYVLEHSGLKVSNLYISQIKRKCGIEVGKNYNLPKSEDSRQPQCPPEKEKAIREAFKYFGII